MSISDPTHFDDTPDTAPQFETAADALKKTPRPQHLIFQRPPRTPDVMQSTRDGVNFYPLFPWGPDGFDPDHFPLPTLEDQRDNRDPLGIAVQASIAPDVRRIRAARNGMSNYGEWDPDHLSLAAIEHRAFMERERQRLAADVHKERERGR